MLHVQTGHGSYFDVSIISFTHTLAGGGHKWKIPKAPYCLRYATAPQSAPNFSLLSSLIPLKLRIERRSLLIWSSSESSRALLESRNDEISDFSSSESVMFLVDLVSAS